MLPQEFIDYTSQLFGEERWQRFLDSFDAEIPAPVSVRLNPFKNAKLNPNWNAVAVPWCRNAYWLSERPQFTLDPRLHAGIYYVQEAGSMFLDTILLQYINKDKCKALTALDMCAAPGGKSTLLRAALPEGSVLFCNEPDHHRSNILVENIQKQGHSDVVVTSNYAKDYMRSKLEFDLILTDVPCSGEGMFRRDEGAIREWSVANVRKCAELQREIVSDIWKTLRPGGLLIYSTCTFNTHEDEENVRFICDELGAEILPVEIKEEWNITGSLLDGFDGPVYRFIPGTTKSEGLFIAVMRKKGGEGQVLGTESVDKQKLLKSAKNLKVLYDGCPRGELKGKNIIPAHAEALSVSLASNKYPQVELTLDDALRYLHREAITLPENTPMGYVIVNYDNHPLGFMKNLGNRANNLYPKEWAIRFLK